MAYLTSTLDIIRGYNEHVVDNRVVKSYQDEYMSYNAVLDAIKKCIDLLVLSKYPDADISEYRTALDDARFGPDIRSAIYECIKRLATEAGISLYSELSEIRYAHYGRDMRDAIYSALIKLGAEDELYIQTTIDDYIYHRSDNGITLLSYKGGELSFIALPTDDGNGTNVIAISPFLFSDNETIVGVKIPSTITEIQ